MTLLFFALGCGTQPMEVDVAYGGGQGDSDGDVDEPAASDHDCVPASPGSYERAHPEHMFGALVFQMDPDAQTFQSIDDMVDMGMNTASLRFFIPFDENGALRYPYTVQGQEFVSLDHQLCFMGNLLHDFKQAGLSIILSGEPHFYDKYAWMELYPDWDVTNGIPGVKTLGDEAAETFEAEALFVMEGLAELSEKYQVEVVSPISEADRFFEIDQCSSFMQDSRVSFQGYGGKLLWQIYGEALLEPTGSSGDGRVDMTGYDIAGLSIIGCDMETPPWDRYIDGIVGWAEEDGVPEVAISEMGCVFIPESVEDAEANFSYWVEKTSEYSTGLILLDTPQSSEEKQGVLGTWVEEWAREYAEELGLL